MELVRNWLRQVIFCMCLLELLYQLAPQKNWQKYMKLTGGLIFMLVLMQPLLQVCSLTENVQNRTWKWSIQQDSVMFLEAQKELEELQSQQIRNELSKELERQITEWLQYYGGKAKEVLVTVREESCEISEIKILLSEKMERSEMLEAQIAASFGVSSDRIRIQTAEGEGE